jgi:hypothetical protein
VRSETDAAVKINAVYNSKLTKKIPVDFASETKILNEYTNHRVHSYLILAEIKICVLLGLQISRIANVPVSL